MAYTKPITVADLIQHLQTLPQDLPVAYKRYSEAAVLELDDLEVYEMQPPREDGWLHDPRPDAKKQAYLVFPGN